MNDNDEPRAEPRVCRMCFSKVHCKGGVEACECPCRELRQDIETVFTTQEWNERQVKEAGIRARMRDVEGKVIQ